MSRTIRRKHCKGYTWYSTEEEFLRDKSWVDQGYHLAQLEPIVPPDVPYVNDRLLQNAIDVGEPSYRIAYIKQCFEQWQLYYKEQQSLHRVYKRRADAFIARTRGATSYKEYLHVQRKLHQTDNVFHQTNGPRAFRVTLNRIGRRKIKQQIHHAWQLDKWDDTAFHVHKKNAAWLWW